MVDSRRPTPLATATMRMPAAPAEKVPVAKRAIPPTAASAIVRHQTAPRAWTGRRVGTRSGDDRKDMTCIEQMVLPSEAFAIAQLIQRSIGEGWMELTRRIPELSAKV
jgi:hypothetical protein